MKKIYLCALLLIILIASIIACSQNARISPETRPAPTSVILHTPVVMAESVEIRTPTATLEPLATEAPTPADTCEQELTHESTEVPAPTHEPVEVSTETPTETSTEAPHTPVKLYFLATAYSSDPVENGGFGAVDCLYGKDLPADAIAADLSILPYGTRVYIDGIGERIVVDTAGDETLENMRGWAKSKKCEGWIDIYVGDDKAWMHDWGVRVVTLTILEWGKGK